MAVQNQVNAGVVDRKTYTVMYNQLYDQVRMKVESNPMQMAQFFAERSTNLEVYREAEVTKTLVMPQINEDTDRIPLVVPAEGFNKSWTNLNYRAGFILSEDAITMQKNNVIVSMFTGLPTAFMNKQELLMASIFDNGFASETTADGQTVFATAHLHEDAEYGTWSNRAASGGGFTTTTYATAWLNMQKRTDEKGFSAPKEASEVVFPVDITEAVAKVRGSTQYPHDALNAVMPKEIFGNFTMTKIHRFSSTTAWFVRAQVPENEKGLIVVYRVRPNDKPISDSTNPDLVMGRRRKMSMSVGALHARDWYGNVGA